MNRSLCSLLIITLVLALVQAVSAQDKGYDVTSYDLHLAVNRAENEISGKNVMTATVTGALPTILQHCFGLSIDSVFVGSEKATIEQSSTDSANGTYFITGYPTLEPGGSITVTTYYHGNPRNEGGSSPWGGVTNNKNMIFAMGVGLIAPYISCTRDWLPCYDLPDDKADSVSMTFITPDSDHVASNGMRVTDSVITDQHLRITKWKVLHPIASYLLTFAVGPFAELDIANPLNIPFKCFALASDSAKTAVEMNKRIVNALTFFDSLYGPYPFEKVGYVVAPIGSMEHQTMITVVNLAMDTVLSSSPGTVGTNALHELSHMWWGDRVTCKTFDDAWLNEGFATFSESLYLGRFVNIGAYWARQHANIASAISSGSSISLFGAPNHTTPRDNYPYPIIYQKGASVLGMLRYIVGDSLFFLSLRNYGNAHAYSNVTSADLEAAFEQTTGQDLGWFFQEWVYGIWYPQISVSWQRKQGSYSVGFTQTQTPTKYRYFRTPVTIEARTKSGQTERAIALMDSLQYSSATLPCSFIPDTIVIDPDGALIKKIVGAVTLGVATSSASQLLQPAELLLQPNPAHRGNVSVRLTNNDKSIFPDTIVLYDADGKQVSDEIVASGSADTIDISRLSSGTYFAKALLHGMLIGEGRLVIAK